MNKWKAAQDSMTVRVATSATTLVAIAAIAGAGWKWG